MANQKNGPEILSGGERRTQTRARTSNRSRQTNSVPKQKQSRSQAVRTGTRRNPSGRSTKGVRRRKRTRRVAPWKRAIFILTGVFLLLITSAIVVVASKWGKVNQVDLDIDKLNISDVGEENATGYLNVALFGLDTRANDPEMGSRSDTIIVASLNRATKEVKLVSVYRDTLLRLQDDSYNKANAAYAYGGAEEAVAMLNENLDLNIQKYITVDFSSLVDVIDALGGVDLEITEDEIPYVNNYTVEIIKNIGKDSGPVEVAGMQHLNGIQATAYARIRYAGDDDNDYRRTERQRKVIEQIALKAKEAKLSTLNKIIDRVFDKVETNFTLTEIVAYAKDIKKYVIGGSQGFPFNLTTEDTDVGNAVIALDLAEDVQQLHEFLFGATDFTPSYTVEEISRSIQNSSYSVGTTYDTEGEYYPSYSSGYDSYSSGGSYYEDSYNDNYNDNSYYEDTSGSGSDYNVIGDSSGTTEDETWDNTQESYTPSDESGNVYDDGISEETTDSY